jgi:hypothetical protein
MTCTPLDQAPRTLREATARAECWANESLVTGERPLLDAVWWLSTHLAAADRVLYRELWKMRENRAVITTQRRLARGTESALWDVERRLTGDGRLAGHAIEPLAAQLRTLVHEYTVGERQLLQRLSDSASENQLSRLARRYAAAISQAPTRPHPLAQRTRALRRFFFRLVGRIDHLRDALDSRHVPRRKRPVAARTSRWSQSLMVASGPAWQRHPSAADEGSPLGLPSPPVQCTAHDSLLAKEWTP